MGRGFGCGDERLIDLTLAASCSRVVCSLSYGCPVYGTFVAAVVAMVSLLGLVCLFFAFRL